MTARTVPAILAVDVEECCHSPRLAKVVPFEYWTRFDRVRANTTWLLRSLQDVGGRGTFFFLPAVAQAFPELVAEVADRGHEVGVKITPSDPLAEPNKADTFEHRARAGREAILAIGCEPAGIRLHCLPGGHASDLSRALHEMGFRYACISAPLQHSSQAGSLAQFSASKIRVAGIPVPLTGEAIRHLPEPLFRHAVRRWCGSQTRDVLSIAVWELDDRQPRVSALSAWSRLVQYRNSDLVPARLGALLSCRTVGSFAETLAIELNSQTKPVAVSARTGQKVPVAGAKPVSVVVPCFNEGSTISYLAMTLAQFVEAAGADYDVRFILVDDGSTDGTAAELEKHFGAKPNATIVRHDRNLGVAQATLTGIRAARTETVCVIDCDCTYDPRQLLPMIPLLREGVAMVTASPYHRLGRVVRVPQWRLFLSRTLSRLFRLVLRNQLATYTSCCRVYRRSAVADLHLSHGGFFGIAEIVARLDLAGATVVEHPATLEARLLGQSKMKLASTIAGHLVLLAHLTVERLRTSLAR
jgi:hypothetical protein